MGWLPLGRCLYTDSSVSSEEAVLNRVTGAFGTKLPPAFNCCHYGGGCGESRLPLALCYLGLEDRIFELDHGMQVRLRLHFALHE